MDRHQGIASVRANERRLKEAGVVRELSILDVVGIEIEPGRLLGVRVDLSEEGTLKPRVWASVEALAYRHDNCFGLRLGLPIVRSALEGAE